MTKEEIKLNNQKIEKEETLRKILEDYSKWLEKASHNNVVCLLPARTDTS